MDGRFDTTNWSAVLEAIDHDNPRWRGALASLCQLYWPPLYAYVRRRGYSVEDAQDLTQAFFGKLFEKDGLRKVRPESGRFRTFLLTSMNHMLSDEQDRQRAAKRGSGISDLSLDLDGAERRFALIATQETPDRLYERHWASAVVDQVFERLEREFAEKNRAADFADLRDYLVGGSPQVPYSKAAERLGTTEAAVKMMVHRLRKKFGLVLRDEIARTVAHADDIDDELKYLLSVLRQ